MRKVTNKEAIEILQRMVSHYQGTLFTKEEQQIKDTFDLAIKALEEQPQGDLISRSELKSILKNECFWCANRDESCDKSCWHCINEKIDNAPTVSIDWGVEGGDRVVYTRPQGEWKLVKDNGNNIHAECPFCKFQIKCIAYNYSIWEVKQFIKNGDFAFEFPNFCEHCGADMRGDEK